MLKKYEINQITMLDFCHKESIFKNVCEIFIVLYYF